MPLFGKINIEKLKAKLDVAGLIKALGHRESGTRVGAAQALGELGDPAVIDELAPLLRDRDGQVQRATVLALEQLGWEPEGDDDRARYLLVFGQWEALADMGESAVPSLVEALRREAAAHPDDLVGASVGQEGHSNRIDRPPSTEGDSRWGIISSLSRIGSPAVDALLGILEEEGATQAHAFWALLEIGEPALGPLLDRFFEIAKERGGAPIRIREGRFVGLAPTVGAIAKAVREARGVDLIEYIEERSFEHPLDMSLDALTLLASCADDSAALQKLDQMDSGLGEAGATALEEATSAAESAKVVEISGPKVASPQEAIPPEKHPEEDYVRRCLEPAFAEEEEPRTWRSDPSFRTVLDALNQRDHRTAARVAEEVTDRFVDFDLGYNWWAGALLALGDVDPAREVLRRGIERSKRKFLLCERIGEAEWRSGDLAEAVYWWAQGVHCQETLEGWGGEIGSYLYLHYVADGMGIPEVASAFVRRVDAIRAGEIRLEPATAANLRGLASQEDTPEVRGVLTRLPRLYLR